MLRMKLAVAAMMIGMLATVLPVLAHHSFSAEYDFAKPITLQGTVVKWELINPHGWITVDAKDANGKVVRWAVETGNPNALLRAGWRKDSLKAGDEVTIEGYLAKDGTPTVNGVQVTLADGRRVLAASSVTNGR
jgi:Family of unknown function (DUF6152)